MIFLSSHLEEHPMAHLALHEQGMLAVGIPCLSPNPKPKEAFALFHCQVAPLNSVPSHPNSMQATPQPHI